MVVLEEPLKDVKVLKNYIGGEWVESKSGVSVDVVNPASEFACKPIFIKKS